MMIMILRSEHWRSLSLCTGADCDDLHELPGIKFLSSGFDPEVKAPCEFDDCRTRRLFHFTYNNGYGVHNHHMRLPLVCKHMPCFESVASRAPQSKFLLPALTFVGQFLADWAADAGRCSHLAEPSKSRIRSRCSTSTRPQQAPKSTRVRRTRTFILPRMHRYPKAASGVLADMSVCALAPATWR